MSAKLREKLWEAVNSYAQACGGDTSEKTASGRRMSAVVDVERAVKDIVRNSALSALDQALNSGTGVYKP